MVAFFFANFSILSTYSRKSQQKYTNYRFDKKLQTSKVSDSLKSASTSRLKPPPCQKSSTNKNEDEMNAMVFSYYLFELLWTFYWISQIWSNVEDANGTYKKLMEVQQQKRKEYLAKKAKLRLAGTSSYSINLSKIIFSLF